MEDRLYSPKEVANYLRVDIQTIYRYIKAGRIKSVKFSRKGVRIPAKSLERFIEENTE